MKRGLFFCLGIMILILLISVSTVYTFPDNDNPNKHNLQEISQKLEKQEKVDVIIKLKPGADFSVKSLNKGNGFKDNSFSTSITKEELAEIENQIEYIEPIQNFKVSLTEAVDIVNASLTWPLQIFSSGVDINLTGQSQTICIIDTGVNFSHPDLIGKNLTCNIYCPIDGGACSENCSETDLHGHGTHVAGIVAASGRLFGIARGSNLIGVKVFSGSSGSDATTASINNGIDWCVANSETYNISVISLSVGSSLLYLSSCDSVQPSFNSSITSAFDKNISMVVATGNEANSTGIASPACISKAIPVGDTYDSVISSISWMKNSTTILCTDTNTQIDDIVCHANRNALVKLFAPGAMINSTSKTGGYEERGGTSMSTPVVSGAIAIINQVLNLTLQTKTPLEIEELLNQTGKPISDSVSGLNFSRVNIYPAVLELDNIAPNITLSTPLDSQVNLTKNQTFICNSSDWQLKNISLQIWDSLNALVYNESKIISGTQNSTSFSYNFSNYDTYSWNCESYDKKNNVGLASANFTLVLEGISTKLISPVTDTYTNQNQTNFTCNSLSEENYNLTNTTFQIWNSSNIIVYNETKNITGATNTTEFNYTFLEQDTYVWNCFSINNNSNSTWGNSNYTVTFEDTMPNLTLITPLPESETSSSVSRLFYFNISDSLNTTCNLVINDIINSTKNISNFTLTQNFAKTFTPGTYSWKINCTDLAGNFNISSNNSFTITAPTPPSSGGSSGGGGGATSSVYTPTQAETNNGYTKSLSKSDKIQFKLFEKNETHYLTLNSIENKSVNLTLSSEPIKITLEIGQSLKLNLTSQDYYDVYIKLENINSSTKKATLRVQTIHELIIPKSIIEEKPIEEKSEESTDSLNRAQIIWIIIISVIVGFLLVVFASIVTHIIEKSKLKIQKNRLNKDLENN